MRPILSDEKSNTADKLRTYINAAYNLALTADSNPKLGVEFKNFYDLQYNPCDKIRKLHSHSIMNERPVLSIVELRHYLKHLYASNKSAHRDLLIISLLCGGKRPIQLSQCLQTDVNFTDKLFTNTGATISPKTLSNCCADISKKMVEIKETSLSFDLHDVRRACETHLARLGVNSDIRSQLLSHGITGLQTKHYDRHDYLDEKKHALAIWQKELIDN